MNDDDFEREVWGTRGSCEFCGHVFVTDDNG